MINTGTLEPYFGGGDGGGGEKLILFLEFPSALVVRASAESQVSALRVTNKEL